MAPVSGSGTGGFCSLEKVAPPGNGNDTHQSAMIGSELSMTRGSWLVIRTMKPDDTAGVVAIVVAAGMFSPDESEVVLELLGHYSAGSAEGHVCLVDEQDDELVGVAYYQPKGPADRVWDLTMIAVLPDVQGGGRGSALLAHVEGRGRGGHDRRGRPRRGLLRRLRVQRSVQTHPRRQPQRVPAHTYAGVELTTSGDNADRRRPLERCPSRFLPIVRLRGLPAPGRAGLSGLGPRPGRC